MKYACMLLLLFVLGCGDGINETEACHQGDCQYCELGEWCGGAVGRFVWEDRDGNLSWSAPKLVEE